MNLAGFYYKRAMHDAGCFSLHARMRRGSFLEYLARARIPVASRNSARLFRSCATDSLTAATDNDFRVP
jgi:hypothetical protein